MSDLLFPKTQHKKEEETQEKHPAGKVRPKMLPVHAVEQ